jgi:hypothetical protein
MFFKVYHHTDNDFVKVQCARGILKAAEDMSELYGVLPLIEGAGVANNANNLVSIRKNNSNNVFGLKHVKMQQKPLFYYNLIKKYGSSR